MNRYASVDEMLMEEELNTKVFKDDPIKKIIDPNRNRTDRFNSKYLIELKSRYYTKAKIESFGGATIEKEKYYALTQSCGDKIPKYINKFSDGSYYEWDLKKIKEPTWYEKLLPKTTNWDNTKIMKLVGDLKFDEATKLI